MARLVAAFGMGFLLALALGAWWWRPSTPPSTSVAEAPPRARASASAPADAGIAQADAGRVERLEAELALERAMRERLLDQVDALTQGLDDFAASELDREESVPPRPARANEEENEEPWFNGDSLAALGFPPSDVEVIREVWERAVMARLENENQRARGVRGSQGDVRQAFEIELRARAELGDDLYDAMLYAAGEPNRVVLNEVLDLSPVSVAGAEPGDAVLSYDGVRVFNPHTLKQLTVAGRAGEQTELLVLRNGQPVRIFVPRGPLGARLGKDTYEPTR